ncbi:OmpP1/FadL family transporter [Flavobacterium wongokense]|uniref:OmpP1/FadL family transporter n=1 Tax=Flavobacterium wongokense TaxID=2910674 RepID=UPI001F428CA5|nr:outer membrane protein transport protein [Flavobacterium sp. WG47]MCF6132605.1 outer membrane protein transport protein [Flavobacterium sp. WG47]
MKKLLPIIIAGLSFSAMHAQETTVDDALRYAVENLTGSARFRGMSGAFGAVGGDLSAINQNPAGSIFFSNNFATLTASSYNSRNSSLYYGTKARENDNSLDLNQAGVVFVFKDNNPKTDWNKFTLAFNYENNNNFNNSIYFRGINPYNSIDRYFLRFANGLPQEGGIKLGVLQNAFFGDLNFIDQQALLGYNAYIFNPDDETNLDNTTYTSNVPTAGNYDQQSYVLSTGYDGKFTANFATSYKDILFLGINLDYHYTDIVKTISVFEQYDTADTSDLESVQFDTETHTFGNGFAFNLGAIVKPTKELRLGVAYQSPTWYRLEDEQRQAVISNNAGARYIYNPGITMLYDAYTVQTPSKWTGSIAYIFGKRGVLSADVSTKDYSKTKFRPKDDFSGLNSYMGSALDNAIEVRIGGEYKYKQVSFRGGYRFEQSPYKFDQTYGDLTGYTGGLGYTFGDSRIDLAYSYDHRMMNQMVLSSGMPTDLARIDRKNHNVSVSYSINF